MNEMINNTVLEQKVVRAVGYIRVSTQEQAEEGYSLEAQQDLIRKHCEKEGKHLVTIYADKGISGKSTKDRIALEELLEESTQGVFDEVIVWKTSRLARNTLDLLQITKKLEENQVEVKSLSESYDLGTSQGKLMMGVLGIIAEFERNVIVDNLKIGMNVRARQGLKNGGKLLGYRSEGRGRDSKLVIIPEEAQLVRLIYKMYAEGKGYKAITTYINKLGYKTVRGNPFSTTGVKEILKNPTYIGKIRYNRYTDYANKRRKGSNENYILADGKHEPIIDNDTWNKVQAIQDNNKGKYIPKYKGEFPLTGILRCPACGSGMVASTTVNTLIDGTKKTLRYYTCGRHKSQGASVCKANSVRADYAEEYVMTKLQEIFQDETHLTALVEKINTDNASKIQPLKDKESSLMNQIETSKVRKSRAFELYEDGIVDKVTLSSRIDIIDQQLSQQQEELKQVQKDLRETYVGKIPYDAVHHALKDLNTLLQQAKPEQRKLFLQLAIEHISVEGGRIKKIHIHFNESLQSTINSHLNETGESLIEGSPISFVFRVAI